MKRTTHNAQAFIAASQRTPHARLHRLRVRLAHIKNASRAVDPYFIPVIACLAIMIIWSVK